jgi:hypothetical protein
MAMRDFTGQLGGRSSKIGVAFGPKISSGSVAKSQNTFFRHFSFFS